MECPPVGDRLDPPLPSSLSGNEAATAGSVSESPPFDTLSSLFFKGFPVDDANISGVRSLLELPEPTPNGPGAILFIRAATVLLPSDSGETGAYKSLLG